MEFLWEDVRKLIHTHTMSSSSSNPFTNPINLDGQSFSHGLSSFSPEQDQLGEFVEDDEMVVFCDEKGVTHVSKQIRLYEEADPIEANTVPTFSKGNKFVEGLAGAISTVPTGGIILYTDGSGPLGQPKIPAGWAECNGDSYLSQDGREVWGTPVIDPNGGAIHIQKLPPGFTKASLFAILGVV